jgi:putative flippase GtrA
VLFLRYVGIGGTAFLVDLLIFLLLVKALGLSPELAQATSRTAGALVGFWGHRHISFRIRHAAGQAYSLPTQAAGYLAITLFGIVVSPLIISVLIRLLQNHVFTAKILTEAVMVCFNFVAMKRLFHRPAAGRIGMSRINISVAKLLVDEAPFAWRLAFTLLAALALTPLVFSWTVVSGAPSAADFPRGDQAQIFAGAFYFYRDVWHLPLLDVRIPGFAQHVNIAFTDSIPLLALPFKLWFKLTGQVVNYTAVWLWLCVLGQALGALALLQQLRLRRPPETVAGVVMAVVMPPFLFRYWMWHLALCGQFVLLFGLALYFRFDRGDRFRAVIATWALLLIVALLIHPYLLAMQLAFFLLYAVRRAAHIGACRTLVLSAGVLSLVVLTMWLCGYLAGGFTRPSSGYGVFSMNVLAPFGAMGKAGVFRDGGHFARGTEGQMEGFSYLGLGLMCAAVVAFLALAGPNGGELRRSLRRHWPLAALSVAFYLYAVSNEVYVANLHVLSYRLPRILDGVTGTFRTSGRFFWPVWYVVLAAALAGVARGLPARTSALLLLAIAALQWSDTAVLRRVVIDEKPASTFSSDPVWQRLVASNRAIALYPPSGCNDDNDTIDANASLQMLAARYGIATNSVSSARVSTDCGRYAKDLLRIGPQPNTLTVLNPPYDLAFIRSHGWKALCHAHGGRFYCSYQLPDAAQ